VALLQRECQIAGTTWPPRPTLDIRLLAEAAEIGRAGDSLDSLCSTLGIEIRGRHTAIGDAEATAKAFLALIPLLRSRNVRTLGEAQAAMRWVAERGARPAGGPMPITDLGPAAGRQGTDDWATVEESLLRCDSFPYQHRVRDVMGTPPLLVAPTDSMQDVARKLLDRKVSSAFVDLGEEGYRYGIVTEHDIMRSVAAGGAKVLDRPISGIMTVPLYSISEDAFLYRAIGRMQRLGFRHLGVIDAGGEIVGALTMRDLLRHRATAAIMLGDAIESAEDTGALGRAWAQLPMMARSLVSEEVRAYTIANVISSEVRSLTRRAAKMAEARMLEAGRGEPPVAYAVLVLGSAGRGESLLAADQDNAIVFASGEPGGVEDRWFEEFARHLSDILDEVGVPYCKGGVMARNAAWRMSLADWKATIEAWVRRQAPEDLLNVDIFFDGIPVCGDARLGESIWRYAYECGARSRTFVKLMIEAARVPGSQAFNFFGGFKRDADGRMDLKKIGLLPITTAARALSIKYDVRLRPTPDRYRAVAAADGAPSDSVERLVTAQETILACILNQQLDDIAEGIPPSNRVAPARLTKAQRSELRSALSDIYIAADLIGEGRF
jgi:DNA polymerase-3 subunit epsilon/CBS domain-containing protein